MRSPALERTHSGQPKLLVAATLSDTLRAFLLPIARHFRALGWRVDALAHGVTACSQCMASFDNVYEIGWSRNPLALRDLQRAQRQIGAIVRREGYDLVHVHTPVAAFATRYALRKLRASRGCAVIYTAHGFHFYQGGPILANAAFLAMEKLAGRWTDYLVVINGEDEQAAKRWRIVPQGRVCAMPSIGLDTEYYCPDAVPPEQVAQLRREMGLSDVAPLFLTVGELGRRKRPWDTIRALASLRQPDAHLAFAGRGPLLGEMQRLATQLGLDGRVHFLGFRNDIPALMLASNAVILPSQQEGRPRSILEALAMGVPAIGSNIRGLRDLLAGGNGLLTEVGDVPGLAQAMEWVIHHPAAAQAMGCRARAAVCETHDLRRILALHDTLYARALEGMGSYE